MDEMGFRGRRIVRFESRRAPEMASLIERHGGVAVSAPTMREVVIDGNPDAIAFGRSLRDGMLDVVVLMTGVGTRALIEEIAPELDRVAFNAALGRVPLLVARGPKPAAVLRELGVAAFVTVPAPNTWRELAATIEQRGSLAGQRVAVQEHGAPGRELYERLRAAGAEVAAVPVYRSALPEDTAPLRRALHEIADGASRVALFTSRAQVEHAFAVAAEEQLDAAVREGLRRGVVASIGPVCSEALRAEGLEPDLVPEHPKMGHLVKAAAERAEAILSGKAGWLDLRPDPMRCSGPRRLTAPRTVPEQGGVFRERAVHEEISDHRQLAVPFGDHGHFHVLPAGTLRGQDRAFQRRCRPSVMFELRRWDMPNPHGGLLTPGGPAPRRTRLRKAPIVNTNKSRSLRGRRSWSASMCMRNVVSSGLASSRGAARQEHEPLARRAREATLSSRHPRRDDTRSREAPDGRGGARRANNRSPRG